MNTLRRTEQFMHWYARLKDNVVKARIAARLKYALLGNFGDHKSVGGGVMEMRIHMGPGYRIYYARSGDTVYVLLLGGNKRTQEADIKEAQKLWKALQETSA
ncbi:type II toxin-antitoxin system RelE/ParE family toxin [uncultured Desulfovibrio sp.]|uniref:type II toxin-antitoxin system RelE/ParE family toxin n=1 Tax=uncultured Desulfovibrio sp. TaxID=167968 RepID=UPI0026279448|nr:type II toxin-antitoxin system RelE/ParE family toxin [uncultured Desulfovibrio sp.]